MARRAGLTHAQTAHLMQGDLVVRAGDALSAGAALIGEDFARRIVAGIDAGAFVRCKGTYETGGTGINRDYAGLAGNA